MLDITTWNLYFIYKKHFNISLSFKQFRDQLIKNLKGLPMQTTATDLFKIKKRKFKHLKTITMQKKFPYHNIIKDTHALKIAFSVTKLK